MNCVLFFVASHRLSLNQNLSFEKPVAHTSPQITFYCFDLWFYGHPWKIDQYAGCTTGLVQDVDCPDYVLYHHHMEKNGYLAYLGTIF